MTSFNDGIEAAAQWMEELAKQAATVAGLREYAENCQISAQNIRALKRPEPSEADWMPIETAPRDGTWIMAWRPPCDGRWEPLVIVRWHEDEDGEGSWAWPDEAYDPYSEKGRTLAEGALDDGDCFWDNEHFTHWMPLPPAPALAQVEKADG